MGGTGGAQGVGGLGRPTPRAGATRTVAQAGAHLAEGQFPPGSMGPKIEAAAQFVEETGGTATITSLERVVDALAGASGTTVTP